MLNCPECHTKLSKFNLGFLSEKRKAIKCPACHTKLTIETPNLDGVALKMSPLIAVFIAMYELGMNNNGLGPLLGAVCGGIFVGACYWVQYDSAQLSIALNEHLIIEEEEFILKLRPPLSNNPSRVEFLKNVYHDAPPERLENIAADEQMTDEARTAARELLQQSGR